MTKVDQERWDPIYKLAETRSSLVDDFSEEIDDVCSSLCYLFPL